MKEIVEDGVRDENKCMGDFSVILYFLWENYCKNSCYKSNQRVLKKNKVDMHSATVLHLIVVPLF
jgi:hypothetical protein